MFFIDVYAMKHSCIDYRVMSNVGYLCLCYETLIYGL